jgi:23S rRNA pseudouridine2605 synthase
LEPEKKWRVKGDTSKVKEDINKVLSQDTVRIAKFLADAGIASRRGAEKLIAEGLVKVNGKVIDSPAQNVTSQDKVHFKGKLVSPSQGVRLWLYYKPALQITSHSDEAGRPTVFANLPKDMPKVISVGRLDYNSEGLLLLTNSGDLAHKFEMPKSELEREYRVRLYGELSDRVIKLLAKGIKIQGIKYQSISVIPEKIAATTKNQWVKVVLKEGKNREIRKVFEHFDIKVNRLIRLRFANFTLGALKPGECKEVDPQSLLKALQALK